MTAVTKKRLKYVLAGVGALYALLFIALGGYWVYGAVTKPPAGPTDLEAHPELQDQILAQRRAQELKEKLKLSDEQTAKVTEIIKRNESSSSPEGDFRSRRRQTEDEIAKVLTPEQLAQAEQEREQMRAQFRGGPGGFMTPERVNAIKQNLPPQLQGRFDQMVQRMQQRRGQRGGGPGGGFGGPGGGGPPQR